MTSGARNPLSEPLCDDLAETAKTSVEPEENHPVVMQGQVARDGALLPPRQDLVQVVGLCQRSMQVFGVRWITAEACVVGGDEPRQPCVRRGNRRYPRQPQLLDHPVLQCAKCAFDASL